MPSEVHLTVPKDHRLAGGLLRYTLDGRDHPSPLLSGGGDYFALVQPLPPLKAVDIACELHWDGGTTTLIPEVGRLRMRIGIPGLRRVS